MGKVPKLRFEGFEGEWEEKKLGDTCAEFKSGTFIKASEVKQQGEYPVYGGNGLRGFADRHNHDGAFALIGRQGALCGNMNFSTGKAYFTEHAVAVQADDDSNTKFLYYLLGMMNLGQYSDQSAQPGLAVNKLIKLKNSFPSKKEQDEIAEILSHLDTLLTLHQRKHTALLKAKQFYLQNLFPRKGEKTPRLRFTGFSGEWERRKLGEVFKEYSIKNHPELPPLTIIQGQGTVLREESERHLQYDKSSLSGYKVVHKDDFIVHLRSFEGGLEIARSDGIVSPAYHLLHGEDTDSRFYYPYFRSKHFISGQLTAFVYGIRDGRSIDIDGMKTIVIPVPSYEEQKTIGDFLTQLDHLITVQTRKLETLKRLKQFMLQNLFV